MGDYTSRSQKDTEWLVSLCHTSVEQSAQSRFSCKSMNSGIRRGHEVSTRGSWKGQGSRELSISCSPSCCDLRAQSPHETPVTAPCDCGRVPLHVCLLPNISASHLWPLPDPMMYLEPQPCWSCCVESLLTEDLEGDRQGRHEGKTHKEHPCHSIQGNVEGTTCCNIHRHAGGYAERTCRADNQGVPHDSIQGRVGSTTCCSTHRLAGRAGGEKMEEDMRGAPLANLRSGISASASCIRASLVRALQRKMCRTRVNLSNTRKPHAVSSSF